MSEADDWTPVQQSQPDNEWTPVAPSDRPFDPIAGEYPQPLPEAFLDRVRAGQALSRITQAAIKEGGQGFAGSTPTGLSDETLNHLIDLGVFHDPARGRGGPIQMINEAGIMGTAQAWQAITGAVNAGIHGAGGALGQIVSEFGGSQGTAERAKNEIINAGNWAMIEGGMGRFSRPSVEGGSVVDKTVGGLPTPQDFTNAAKVLEPPKEGTIRFYHGGSNAGEGPVWLTPQRNYAEGYARAQVRGKVFHVDIPKEEAIQHGGYDEINNYPINFEAPAQYQKQLRESTAEANLKTMWQEDGIHPAEAVHDAQGDAFAKNEITAPHVEVKPDPEDAELLSADGQRVSLSAARTDPSELPSPDVQPVRPGLAAQASKAIEDLHGLATNIQYIVDPMATGSKRAIVPVKDAANSVRRIRFDHARTDADLVKKFDGEALDDMWRAADEESVARQTGDIAHENIGLSRLEPEQRAAVEKLQQASQQAWLQAVDAGLVEGEGLPSYTPRMMANVAMASDSMAPRALNELGRNVFTRTTQMLHRGNLEAHETEAAAQKLVRDRMTEQGATPEEIEAALEKVKLIRNIRVLPMATARLQEAVVWKNMINQIEAIGKAAGSDTVVTGAKPQGWFTLDHPAFRKWRPKFGEQADGTIGPVKDGNGNIIFEPQQIYMHPEFRGPMMAILDDGANVGKAIPGAQSLYGALMAIKGKAMTAILNSPLIHNQVVWGKVAEAAGGREWMGFGLYFRGNKIVNGATGRAQELIERGLNPIGNRASYQDITGEMEAPELGAAPGRSLTAQVARFIPDFFDEARPNQTVGGPGDKVAAAIDKAGDFWHNTLLWDRVRDVHFGLADYLSDKMVADGVDRLMADRIATHFSNIIVGSIPKEAMSAGARATANLLLFSRSFTLGNLSTFKQAAMGLPKPILAQLERDFGMPITEGSLSPEAAAAIAKMSKDAQWRARSKAFSTIALSAGMFYIGNALVQHAFNVVSRRSDVSDELKGYVRRWNDAVDAIKEDPFELKSLVARLSPTWDNEPGKSDRAYIGNDSRGRGIYARLPFGKFGEEMVGWPTQPMEMLKRKLSPGVGGFLDVLFNDAGFGQKMYNDHDKSAMGMVQGAFAAAKHMVMKHLPEGQMGAIGDLLHGDGDKLVNAARLIGPALGFTTSRGAPKGPQQGEQLEAKSDLDARFSLAWPDIKKQIQSGDVQGAQKAMTALRFPLDMQRGLIKSAQSPAGSFSGRTLRDFYQSASPEQIRRFERKSANPGIPEGEP